MKRWCVALVWMLVLALPLQGLAAGARLLCHHAAPAAPAMEAGGAPCHDGSATADPAPAHAGCIACAACHGVAALPSRPPVIAPAAPSPVPEARRAAPARPWISAGPERPPRTDLA